MEHDLTFTFDDDDYPILPAIQQVLHTPVQDATAAANARQNRQVRGEVKQHTPDSCFPARANPYGSNEPEVATSMSNARDLDAQTDQHAGPWQPDDVGELCRKLLSRVAKDATARYAAGQRPEVPVAPD